MSTIYADNITMSADGDIDVNGGDVKNISTINPDQDTKITFVNDNIHFDLFSSTSGLYMKDVGDEAFFGPTASGTGWLGSSSRIFNTAYVMNVWRTWEYQLSDRRVKENIFTLENSLSKIMALRGVKYDIDTSKHPFFKDRELKEGEEENLANLGFIAQELKEVLPTMVSFNKEMDLYTVRNYEQMLPVIVEAVKELKNEKDKEIEELKAMVRDLADKVEKLEKQ